MEGSEMERKAWKGVRGRGRHAREVERGRHRHAEDRAHIPLHLRHLLFSISPLPTSLTDQSGPIRDHSSREGSRKRREGEQEKQERKKDMSVREVGKTEAVRGGTQWSWRQRNASMMTQTRA